MDAACELAVLMAARVHGRADATAIACAAGIPATDAAAALAALRARADVAPAPAPAPSGVVQLTDSGRAALARLLAAEAIDRTALASAYDRFLAADRELKRAISAWQLADDVGKPAARAAVMAVAATAGGVADAIANVAPRFRPYAGRLAVAADAVATGDARYVASPRVDSMHQVWFELHEDLLATLGRSRTS
jgi:hypothetical protein